MGEKRTPTFGELLGKLEKKAAGRRLRTTPDALPCHEMRELTTVFQPRQGQNPLHVASLSGAAKGSELPPITLFRAGMDAYVVDGHHTRAAYRDQKITGPVPVRWFQGTAQEAALYAREANSRDKLPLSPAEKADDAWRLVASGRFKVAELAAKTGVSERTIKRMRAQAAALGERAGDFPTWPAAVVSQGVV